MWLGRGEGDRARSLLYTPVTHDAPHVPREAGQIRNETALLLSLYLWNVHTIENPEVGLKCRPRSANGEERSRTGLHRSDAGDGEWWSKGCQARGPPHRCGGDGLACSPAPADGV